MALSSRLTLRNARQACICKRSRVDNLVGEQSQPILLGKVRTRAETKGRSESLAWTRRRIGAREYTRQSNCNYGHSGSSRSCLKTITIPISTDTQRTNQSVRDRNRQFHTYISNTTFFAGSNTQVHQICRRCFTTRSSPLWNATQEAPNAKAYLNSGAIAGARDLVDVKKVLVIGSGGLAIGQAGEFDYSGKLFYFLT